MQNYLSNIHIRNYFIVLIFIVFLFKIKFDVVCLNKFAFFNNRKIQNFRIDF